MEKKEGKFLMVLCHLSLYINMHYFKSNVNFQLNVYLVLKIEDNFWPCTYVYGFLCESEVPGDA